MLVVVEREEARGRREIRWGSLLSVWSTAPVTSKAGMYGFDLDMDLNQVSFDRRDWRARSRDEPGVEVETSGVAFVAKSN